MQLPICLEKIIHDRNKNRFNFYSDIGHTDYVDDGDSYSDGYTDDAVGHQDYYT